MKNHPFRLLILILMALMFQSIAAGTSTFTLITLAGPGSQGDTAARYFSQELERHLHQRVIVVNSPGGDGLMGMQQFMNNGASCDSLMLGNATILYAALHKKELGFDAMKEFMPIYGMANSNSVIVVPASSSIYTLKDMIAFYAKEQRLVGGSISPALSTSLGMLDESLHVRTDVIHYQTSPAMLKDLVSGRLDYSIVLTGTSAIQGLLESGKLRVIAATDKTRHPLYPDIPTIVQQGYGSIEMFNWGGFFANDDTTMTCRRRLEAAVKETINSARGETFSEQPGAPRRWLADKEQMGEIMQRQLKQIALLQAR